jgi:hypothetical protein
MAASQKASPSEGFSSQSNPAVIPRPSASRLGIVDKVHVIWPGNRPCSGTAEPQPCPKAFQKARLELAEVLIASRSGRYQCRVILHRTRMWLAFAGGRASKCGRGRRRSKNSRARDADRPSSEGPVSYASIPVT